MSHSAAQSKRTKFILFTIIGLLMVPGLVLEADVLIQGVWAAISKLNR